MRFYRIIRNTFTNTCTNCMWIPQNGSGIRKCKRVPQTVIGFHVLVITELAYEQL